MNKLEELLNNLYVNISLINNETIRDKSFEDLEIIRKELKVLEIIKNKLVFPLALMSMPYELYNSSVSKEQQLTQEEYDKVKEWLKNDK